MRLCYLLLLLTLTSSYNPPEEILPVITLEEVIVTSKRLVPDTLKEDWLLLARLIQAEAGGEPEEGKLAVASTVINISKYKNWTIRRTIYDKGRFDGIHSRRFLSPPDESCKEVARQVILGYNTLPASVMYFHNPKISTDTAWVKFISKYPYKKIGNHLFCYHPKLRK